MHLTFTHFFLVTYILPWLAVALVPRHVRSLAWVMFVALATATFAYFSDLAADADTSDVLFRTFCVFGVVFLAMLNSELIFHRKHGSWRFLDGEHRLARSASDEV